MGVREAGAVLLRTRTGLQSHQLRIYQENDDERRWSVLVILAEAGFKTVDPLACLASTSCVTCWFQAWGSPSSRLEAGFDTVTAYDYKEPAMAVYRRFRPLKGRRIAVLAADGFEKIELTVPVAALRLAGARVDVISLRHGRIRGVNLHEPASRVRVDATVWEADAEDYHGLLIPGGFISPDLLRQSTEARRFVQAFDLAHKPIASLCHGPWVLASAGSAGGRTLTSWPGVRDDMVHAGATWLDRDVVRDGNLVTSRGPQDLVPFIREMYALFSESIPIRRPAAAPGASSPQRKAPPQIVVTAMKWMPRPSLRTALLGALAIAFAGRTKRLRPVSRASMEAPSREQEAAAPLGS